MSSTDSICHWKPTSKMIRPSSLILFPALISFAAYLLTPAEAFGSLILSLAGTSYVLTSAQTTLAIASLAGLALAKEALLFAELSRRSKRSVDDNDQLPKISSAQFNEFFDVIAQSDVADCGKFLVCEIMAQENLHVLYHIHPL